MTKLALGLIIVVACSGLVFGADTKAWWSVLRDDVKGRLIAAVGYEEVTRRGDEDAAAKRASDRDVQLRVYEEEMKQAPKKILDLQKQQVQSMLQARTANLEVERACGEMKRHADGIEKVADILSNPGRQLRCQETGKPFSVKELREYVAEKQVRVEELKAEMRSFKHVASLHMQNASGYEADWHALLKNAELCRATRDRFSQRQAMLDRLKRDVEVAVNERVGLKNNCVDITMGDQANFWKHEEAELEAQFQNLTKMQEEIRLHGAGRTSIDHALEEAESPETAVDELGFSKKAKSYVNEIRVEIGNM